MTYHAKVVSGQIVLPPELRRDAGIEDGDSLVIELNPDGGLTMKTYAQVVREVQSEFRSMAKPADRNLVDELLAERRADAVRENTEIEDWRTRHTA
ncbi:AbrB/MazE/SpoVT family DNA-binding domain-containing protein [Sphingomonas sp. CFBP 13728]|uniref:AbrB/MazE/SpoVT family DNA-binding domain-containing protein n=1 Tax=Sphingomonas sp. CFBP 13728 TaxID=2775294 RepID=UPI0017813A37|nr:AbrB/MazE/SpoVT family DNA-binding domain-containing protein [Sphingomonas sp. CFBP 13728]MBD8619379.1 AbrB/MazE/SpoVT family DNA-binding domain-containing protein [Sphingomonas sp. CFBP 13728]